MESVKLDLSACITFLFTCCLDCLHHDLRATKTTTMPCLGQLPPTELREGKAGFSIRYSFSYGMKQLGNLRAGLDTS